MNAQKIRNLIEQDRIVEAIEALPEFDGSKSHASTVLLSRYNRNQNRQGSGVISNDYYNLELNKIIAAVMGCLPKEKKTKTSNNSKTLEKPNSMQAIIKYLVEIQNKVRFGFSKETQNAVNELLEKARNYSFEKQKDNLFDVSEEGFEEINKEYTTFLAGYYREIRTKRAVDVANIKRMLEGLSKYPTIQSAKNLAGELAAFDNRHQPLVETAKVLSTESSLTNFCQQLAGAIDNLN